ncbi:MAG: glycosyltransferase family 4 protein, partial [Chloroflexota bacterium]|nr:glycosyltransferase family 4 protein [Chloroflexota bacterium]
MKRLLVFNLATDADDPILGFTSHWIARLAAHFDTLDVITMRAGRLDLPANVRVWSVGKERGHSEARRALIFYGLLSRALLTRRYAACFAHMMPLFALMGAPLLTLFSVPMTLWYTHRQDHRVLRMAARLSRRVVTAAPDSFPFHTPKLRAVGHGIDTAFFAPDESVMPDDPPTIVQVARLMSIKRQATAIRALAHMTCPASLLLIGGVPPEQDDSYRRELTALASDLGVADRVTFAGDQPRDAVRDACRRASIALNLSPPGLFDKAALESMSCGVPTVVANTAFDALLGAHSARLCVEAPDDADGLAARLDALLALTADAR